jgi:hypothetical protein
MKTSVVRRWAAIGLATGLLALGGCAKSSTVNGAGGLGASSPSLAPTVPGTSGSATAAPTVSSTPTSTPTHTKTKTPSPTIDSFVVSQKPMCPVIATSDAPGDANPGFDIKLSWHVTGGATKVALSLDDPGFFKKFHTGGIADYPTTDEVDLAFECDPAVQPNTTHTYTLDTIGGGSSVEKTVTVTVQTSP